MVMSAQGYEKDNLKLNDGSMLVVTFVGHGSLIFNHGKEMIYIDPAAQIADYKRMPKGTVLLYTHHHGDHFDVATANSLSSERTTIVGSRSVIEKLGRGKVMNNGDTLTIAQGVKVKAVPAYNTTEEHLQFHPKGRDNGYVLEVGGSRIYIAGDTEPIEEMKQLGDIDIAFLPVNQPYTMSLGQAVKAVEMIKPKVFYPYHFSDTHVEALKKSLSLRGVEVRLRNMK